MCGLVTVSGTLTCEAVALHATGEALTLGGAGDVDERDAVEDLDGDVLSELVAGDVVHADLGHVATRGDAGLLEVTCDRLVGLTRVDLAVGDLDGVVAIGFLGANLGHNARPSLDDGDRDDTVLLVEDLGHAELGAQNALDLVFTHYLFSAKFLVDH